MVAGLAAVIAVTLMTAGQLPTATAAAAEPYGEVTRFGGAVGEFAVSGTTAADEGKFVTPVGFAVDPEEDPVAHEKNVVYVLDRTLSEPAHGELDYRLQKISSTTHEVIASATIAESFTETTTGRDAHPLVGLAVDPAQKRVYTIVESMVLSESGGTEYVPVAAKLVAWSTEQVGKQLVRASPLEFGEDPITKASVIAGESALKATGGQAEVLYAPEGLASDRTNGDVAIEAQHGVSGAGKPFTAGPTTIQMVHTEGVDAGQLGQSWVESEPVQETTQWLANGLFAGEESEVFGVDLYTTTEARPHLGLVKMSGTPSETEIASFTTAELKNRDEAPSVDLETTPFGAPFLSDTRAFSATETAGTAIVQIGSNKYAALFAPAGTKGVLLDGQALIAPWILGGTERARHFWINGGEGGTKELANMGVRIFEGDGKVVDTIGGGTPNGGTATGSSQPGSCNIDFKNATLAAGAGGSIFVLTQPREKLYDDEVIEFAPGGKAGKCPSVREGNVEVQEGGVWKELQAKGEPEASVTVDEGVPTMFSAMSLDQPRQNLTWSFTTFTFEWPLVYEWTPFAFEWNFEGKSTGGPGGDGYTVVNKMEEGNGYKWPTPEAEYTFNTSGIYDASVRLYGDYGTDVVPFIVHVLGSTPPEASFVVPGSITAGTMVTFDASGSKPTPGAEIEYYEWNFGAGPVITTEKTIEHEFASAGKYKVTLVIHDKQGTVLTSGAAEHEVTVEPATTTTTTTSTSSSTTTSTHTTSSTTTTHTTSTTSSGSGGKKGLTQQQKLQKALKACHKDKSKKKRKACEKAAHKRYGPKKAKAGKK